MPANTKSKKKSPSHPPQSTPKPIESSEYTEDDVQMALKACSDKNPGAMLIAEAARQFNIPPQTLSHRTRGIQSRKVAHQYQQLLTAVQELALARFCQARGWRGEPVDLVELRQLAKELCGHKVGDKWHLSFMKRHPEIKRRWAKGGESKRANALNRYNTASFYAELQKAREGIGSKCIWNCDEKGILENGGAIRRRVVVGSDQKDPKVTADESRKMVTIIECVSAAGAAIGPLVIHEGAEKDGEWIRANPCGSGLAASPNGWTNSEVAYEWLVEIFDPQTAVYAKGSKRLLILDGHISHCSLKFILYAARKNIVVLLLPPHTTHRLQPLDVGVFGPLSHAWKKVVKDLSAKGYLIRKNNLISAYSVARKQALTKDIICAAFKRCGIEPFDPSVITEEDVAPAERNAITASQPLPPALPPFLEIVYSDPISPPNNQEDPSESPPAPR
ncbi:hypothetical protein M408DRAFT_324190, partial [Serendipita vermifera MAFF 305830]